jgi:hypothetical protein
MDTKEENPSWKSGRRIPGLRLKKTTLSKKGTGDHHLMVENGQQKMHETSNKSQKNVVSYSQ